MADEIIPENSPTESEQISLSSSANSSINHASTATSERKQASPNNNSSSTISSSSSSQNQKNLQSRLQQLQKLNRLKGIKEIADYDESREEEILKRIEEERRLKKESKRLQKDAREFLNSSESETDNVSDSSLSSSRENEVKLYNPIKSESKLRRASNTTNYSSLTNLSVDSGDPLSNAVVFPLPKPLESPTNQGRKRTNTISSWFQRLNASELPAAQGQESQAPHSPQLRRPSRQLSYASVLGRRTPVFGPNSTFPNVHDGTDEEVISLLLDSDFSDSESELELDSSSSEPKSLRVDKGNDNGQEQLSHTLSKRETIKIEVTKKLEKMGFFDPKFERVAVVLKFLRGYAIIISLIMGIFGLFWGCLYHRERRFVNLSFLVVLDDPGVYENLEINDYFSRVLVNGSELSTVKTYAGWKFVPYTEFTNNATDLDRILSKRIYHEKNWCVLYVKPNSTLDYFNSLQDSSSFNLSDVYHVYYETGRNMAGVSSYVTKAVQYLQMAVLELQQSEISTPLISHLNQSQINRSLDTLLTPIKFSTKDLTSASLLNPISLGPQQFGLVYLHLLSLMQFAFFQPFHVKIESKLTNRSFVLYRLVSSQITYLTIALAYTLVQIAFGVNIYTAYPGRAGFAIFWIFTYLMLSALGGVNENVALLIQSLIPNITPTWMFFWMVVNIAPTYYPLSLAPKFYRYAYAMPIFNGYETYRILLFNTWKPATLARNVVVLVAWVVITNIALPFTMKFYTKKKTEETLGKIKELKKLKKLRKRAINLTDKGLQRAADVFHAHSSAVHSTVDDEGCDRQGSSSEDTSDAKTPPENNSAGIDSPDISTDNDKHN